MVNINEALQTQQEQQKNDNTIAINGVELPFLISDEMVASFIRMASTGRISAAAAPKATKAKWEIVKVGKMYTIKDGNWHSTQAHKDANKLIKALKDIQTITVPNKNGVGTHFAWGYTDKQKAEKMMATLPDVIPAAE